MERITSPKSTRSRICEHHLGHGIDQRPGRLGHRGIRTKRVSALIGNHQLAGTAEKRVSVPNGDRNGSEEDLIFENISKGIHDDEKNVCL